MAFAHNSKGRLTPRDLERFPTGRLFDRLGRAVCQAGCLPRKELYEAWEVARRVRRWFRGGRVVDLCGGHGLLAQVMLLLDDSSPSATVVDTAIPPSSMKLHRALVSAWPRLSERVVFITAAVEDVAVDQFDIVVSNHACGTLTDRVLDCAAAARARVAVLPCCHALGMPEARLLDGWMDGALAIDAQRAIALAARGYRVRTQLIPATITPKNRLLIGEPTMSVSD
jgi:hypothetical protein